MLFLVKDYSAFLIASVSMIEKVEDLLRKGYDLQRLIASSVQLMIILTVCRQTAITKWSSSCNTFNIPDNGIFDMHS